MIAEKQEEQVAQVTQKGSGRRSLRLLRIILSLLLGGIGIYFAFRDVTPAEMGAALAGARPPYVLAAVLVIIITGMVKTWRWRLMFSGAPSAPGFSHLFWTLHLAQLANTAAPFFRIGELVRIFDLHVHTGQRKARIAGTLLVEKAVELVTLAATIFILLPFLALPEFVRGSGLIVAGTTVAVLLLLWLVAANTGFLISLARSVLRRLPEKLEAQLFALAAGGLEGLSALRQKRAITGLLLASALTGILYVLTPFLLFPAFDIKLGLPEAAAVHGALSLGTLPSWAPANAGIFEFLVAFMLRFFGETEGGVILAYTLTYHLAIIAPQVILGSIAVLRGHRLNAAVEAPARERA